MINYFSKYRFIFYLCNFILIVLYLFPGSLLGCYFYDDCKIQPQITANFIVSTNHLYAYIVLSVIGFLTFRKNNQFNILSIYLIFLSIALEVVLPVGFGAVPKTPHGVALNPQDRSSWPSIALCYLQR